MRVIDRDERRARLGARHHLAKPGSSVEAVASDLVGLHSTDPVTVLLSARARVEGFTVADLEEALYERRSLVRTFGMRRTLWVQTLDVAATMDAASTRPLAGPERRRLVKMLSDQALVDDPEGWVADVEGRTLAALEARGEASAKELTEDVPELAVKISYGEGKRWAGAMGVSTRMVILLGFEGRILRTRPLGSWVSSQYRYAPTAAWLGRELPALEPDAARADLAGRWLRTFGPGTATDLKWWTGWTVAQTKAALAAVDAVEVALDEGTGFVPPDDLEPAGRPRTWVALLPGLDPTVMGWKERDWYLGPHEAQLFDRNGNAGQTIWVDGRVVGAWTQRKDGEIVTRLLEPVEAEAETMIEKEVARLADWLGEVRVSPRFPTPLNKELMA